MESRGNFPRITDSRARLACAVLLIAALGLLASIPAPAQTTTPSARPLGMARTEAPTDSAEPDSTPARRGAVLWVLLVDVGDYEDDSIADLPATQADMDALEGVFATMAPPSDGRPFSDVVTWRLSATKPGLQSKDRPKTRQLRELFVGRTDPSEGPTGILSIAESGDTVLFFFGGHGMTPEVQDPGARRQQYILPMNADPHDLAGTAIPLSELLGWLDQLEAKDVRATLFLDACRNIVLLPPPGRSGIPEKRGTMSAEFLDEIKNARGTAIYTSVRESEVAFNDDFPDPFDPGQIRPYGVFTRTVVEGLLGAADVDGNRLVTLSELSAYTTPNVVRHVQSRRLGTQNPSLRLNEVSGELVLGLVPPTRAAISGPPQPTPDEKPSSPPPTEPNPTGMIWLIVVGLGLLLVVIVVVAYLLGRGRKRPAAGAVAVAPPVGLAGLAAAEPVFVARCWSDRLGAPPPPSRDLKLRPRTHSASYRIGESVRLYLQVERDCHVVLANLGSSGKVTVLLPNGSQRQPFLRGGEVIQLPSSDWGFDLEQQGPPGRERVVLLASTQPFPPRFQPAPGEFFTTFANTAEFERALQEFQRSIGKGGAWGEGRCEWDVLP